MKKLFIVIIIILVLGGVYVLFTLKSGQEINEASPLENTEKIVKEPQIADNLEGMDDETMEDFTAQVDEMKGTVMEKAEEMPTGAKLLSEGGFMKRFHSVEGKALLIEDGDEKILRFEDFNTDNGPNLHIYLSSNLGNDDFVDLGKIRATRGNVNYKIDSSIDTVKYNKVLVWCVPFGVLFSYAELIELN